MNYVLERYKLKTLQSRNDYKNYFTFPIENYYKNLGFDFSKTPFPILAREYIDRYQPNSAQCGLIEHAEETIVALHSNGYKQIVLSASREDYLIDQISKFDIAKYFDNILGINDILATSKIEIGKRWINDRNIKSKDILVIGDTMHDYEVANALECQCILYRNGHQVLSNERIENAYLIDDLKEAINIIGKIG